MVRDGGVEHELRECGVVVGASESHLVSVEVAADGVEASEAASGAVEDGGLRAPEGLE